MRYKSEAVCGDRLEFTFENGQAADFIKVTAPSGRESILEPFIKRPVRFEYDETGLESILPEAGDQLCCRYTPLEPGEYTCTVYESSWVSETVTIHVGGQASRGCIGVSKRDSRRYFAYANGTPFLPLGINLTRPESWIVSDGSEFGLSTSARYIGIRQYESWFRRCASSGVNMVRLWLGDPYFSPDTEQARVFRWEQYAKLDAIVGLAKEYGLVLKLTVEQFRYMDYTREPKLGGGFEEHVFAIFNKRLWDGDRRCESTQEWAQDEHWRALWLLKLKELSKRYGGDPSIFAIELWNEMNCLQVDSMDVLIDWNRTMLPRVKALFPDNMVINSLGSLDGDGPLEYYHRFCWDKSDFKQMHRYFDRGAKYKECGDDPIAMITMGMDLIHDDSAPLLVAETGAVNNCHSGPFLYYARDNRGILFADTVYTPLFWGAAGCGNIWHWDVYVQQKNLYSMFAPLRELIKGIAFDAEEFASEDLSDGKIRLLVLKGRMHILGYLRNRDDNWRTNFVQDRAPVPVGGEYPMPKGRLTVIPIWPDETGKLALTENRLQVESLLYGSMFRIDL